MSLGRNSGKGTDDNGAPGVTRTPGPRFRKPLLYPPELQAHGFILNDAEAILEMKRGTEGNASVMGVLLDKEDTVFTTEFP